MTKEELLALAEKIQAKQATNDEKRAFIAACNLELTEVAKILSSSN